MNQLIVLAAACCSTFRSVSCYNTVFNADEKYTFHEKGNPHSRDNDDSLSAKIGEGRK